MIKPSDVSVLKEERSANNKNPDRAWCEGPGVTICTRSTYKLEGKLPIGVALANKLRDSDRKVSDTIVFESEMRLLTAADIDQAGLKKLTGVDTPVAGVLEQNMFYVNQVMRFGKLLAVFQPNPADANSTIATVMIALAVSSEHAGHEEEVPVRSGAAEPGAVAGAARQQFVQHRQLDQRRACRAMSATGSRRSPASSIGADDPERAL